MGRPTNTVSIPALLATYCCAGSQERVKEDMRGPCSTASNQRQAVPRLPAAGLGLAVACYGMLRAPGACPSAYHAIYAQLATVFSSLAGLQGLLSMTSGVEKERGGGAEQMHVLRGMRDAVWLLVSSRDEGLHSCWMLLLLCIRCLLLSMAAVVIWFVGCRWTQACCLLVVQTCGLLW